MEIEISEIDPQAHLAEMLPLLQQLNEGMVEENAAALLERMLPLGYRCVAAFESKRMIGLCGFWQRVQFWNESSLQVDNLVVDGAYRSKRIGGRLIDFIEEIARKEDCKMLVLDSYVHNHPSHRFYFRHGYVIRGYHFTKDV